MILATRDGKSIRFHEQDARPMGRSATGVRGISLTRDDEVVGMEILTNPDATILTTTENGYGKRTPLDDYRVQNRGGQGIITIRTNERNGEVVGVAQVVDDDEVMLITDGGKVLRCRVPGSRRWAARRRACASWSSRHGEKLVSVARVTEEDVAETGGQRRPASALPRSDRARSATTEELDEDLDRADVDAELDEATTRRRARRRRRPDGRRRGRIAAEQRRRRTDTR